MATNQEIIERWVQEVRTNKRFLRPASSNIEIHRDRLYSYGTHFELARWVPASQEHEGFWLLNGDTYSVSTTRHQNMVRDAVQRTDRPAVILPHTALASARIEINTVVPVDITGDRYVPDVRTYSRARLPHYLTYTLDENGDVRSEAFEYYKLVRNPDDTYTFTAQRHVLGESVFRAQYTTYSRGEGYVSSEAYFLSAFDHQETNQHYFLCQLPEPATSVEHAFQVLRPEDVLKADALELPVVRQGDIFAIPTILTTREVRKGAESVERGGHLLGTSHTATEVVVRSEGVYARGILRHRPSFGRAPEHRQQRMGDQKTWHLIQKNTVPVDQRGENRAWSIVGNVD